MIPIEFPEGNLTWAKEQPQYIPLPGYLDKKSPEGRAVFCWQLTDEEREIIAKTGVIWHSVYTYFQPLQPQLLSAEKPEMEGAPVATL